MHFRVAAVVLVSAALSACGSTSTKVTGSSGTTGGVSTIGTGGSTAATTGKVSASSTTSSKVGTTGTAANGSSGTTGSSTTSSVAGASSAGTTGSAGTIGSSSAGTSGSATSGASGSGTSAGGASTSGGTIDTSNYAAVLSAILAQQCASEAQCAAAAPYVEAQCQTSGPFATIAQRVASEVDAGLLAYNSATAQACLSRPTGCNALGSAPASCSALFTGTVATGGACYQSLDCAAGYCAFNASSCPGTCTAFLGLNANCGGGDQCGPDLTCTSTLADGGFTQLPTCQPAGQQDAGVAALGQPCLGNPSGNGAACEASAYCPASSTNPVCTALVGDGGACSTDQFSCADTLKCLVTSAASTTGACLPEVDVGSACYPATLGSNGCLSGLACLGPDGGSTGTCQLPPTSGPCAADARAPCEILAHYCDPTSNTCLPLKGAGQACDPNLGGADCQSVSCDFQTQTCGAGVCRLP